MMTLQPAALAARRSHWQPTPARKLSTVALWVAPPDEPVIKTTIVHISISKQIATVTVNGVARMYRLNYIPPLELFKMYRTQGYKYVWLNNDVILLTKKNKNQKGLKAA